MKGEGKKSRVNKIRAADQNEKPWPEPPKQDDNMYNVEAIRRKRLYKGQLQYLIKWEDWPESTNTWEPLEHLENVLDLVDEFEAKLKSGNCKKHKRKREDPPQPPYPSIANPHIVRFADEEETNGDAPGHASLEDKD